MLLLADLARSGVLSLDDPLAAHLPELPLPHPNSRRITLRHLATHTSGLPRIPADLIAGALVHPYANGYARYDTERLLHLRPDPDAAPAGHPLALLQLRAGTARPGHVPCRGRRLSRPAHRPGAETAGAQGHDAGPRHHRHRRHRPPDERGDAGAQCRDGSLYRRRLGPGHPGDLLSYLEAHLSPEDTPLAGPLREVQVPLLRRGLRKHDTHTLTWYQHPAARGPLLFHVGATFGQQAFLGYHPASQTGLVALATRRGRTCHMISTAYELLYALAADPTP